MTAGDFDLVVVANRLPVDFTVGETGDVDWSRSPGGLVTALAPDDAGRRRRLGRLVRRRRTSRTSRSTADGMRLRPGHALRARRSSSTTRASPTTPSGRCTTTSSPPRPTTAQWWEAYRAVNRRFAEAAAEQVAAGRHRLGARLPAAARPGDGARAAARRADRLLQPHPVPAASRSSPSCRGGGRSSRASSAPTSSASSAPATPPNFVARRAPPHRPHHPRPGRHASPRHHGARRSARCAPPPFPISIDSKRFDAARPPPGRPGARPRDPHASSATRRRCCSASTGSTTPRASGTASRRSASCVEDGRLTVPESTLVQVASPSRENVEAYQQLREEVELLGRPDQRRLRAPRAPGRALPAPLLPAGGDGGAVPGGRRHARHRAARRHEPRRQGVRRRPLGRPRACSCCREFTGAADELARRRHGQPARHRRHEGHDRHGGRDGRRASSASGCAGCVARSWRTTSPSGRSPSCRCCPRCPPRRPWPGPRAPPRPRAFAHGGPRRRPTRG